jgi:hypothetical protein
MLSCLAALPGLNAADIQQDGQQRIDVGLFSQGLVEGWQYKEFEGKTEYSLKPFEETTVLEAVSEGSASAFYYAVEIDLEKTPYLNWSWRKINTIDPGDENKKSGDDFVARVYVIKDGGVFFWKTLAINYVWSYEHTKQQVWDNPFAGDNAIMLSQRDASDPESTWFQESRNVAEDFRNLHGQDIRYIDGVAIMTDSDNSGLTARALYGDIFFSASP